MNHTITSPIAPTQMRTDASLGRASIGIVTVVQNHQLDITEEGFHRIVIRTAFGQRHPVQLQCAHCLTGLARFTWMRPLLIKGDPHVVRRIPAAHLFHELTYLGGAFAWHERPVGSPAVDRIEEQERALPSGRLLASQHELLCRRLSSATIGFHSDDLDVKDQQDTLPGPMPPEHAQAAQNRAALRIVAAEFALDAA